MASMADGAFMFGFVIPHANARDPATPVSVSVSAPVRKILRPGCGCGGAQVPREAQQTRPGQIVNEGVVVALLGTGSN